MDFDKVSSKTRFVLESDKPTSEYSMSKDNIDAETSSVISNDRNYYVMRKKKSDLRSINSESQKQSKSLSTRFKGSRKNLVEFTNEQKILLRKKFVRSVNLCIFCFKWSKWAYTLNTEMRDKYLSFSQMYDFEYDSPSTLKPFQSDDTNSQSEIVGFNKEYYKANRKLVVYTNLSPDAKQVLKKEGPIRTKGDLEILKSACKHVKSLNILPVEMQTQVFKSCWLEMYESKRVVIRQHQKAEYFYFIVSGSLVVTNKPDESQLSYTVCFLETGMSFGELALLSKSPRTSTVISRTRVELLVLAKEDFFKIFNGEKDDSKSDPNKAYSVSNYSSISSKEISNFEFLRKLNFLRGWPVETIINNPKAIVTCYFPRGQILARNTNYSKYIYIIKKGTLSVWIKLKKNKKRSESQDPSSKNIYKSYTHQSNAHSNDAKKELSEDTKLSLDEESTLSLKLGGDHSFFESDKFLKEQHNETLKAMGYENTDNSDRETVKDYYTSESKLKTNNIMEFIKEVKHRDSLITNEIKVPKGAQLMPGTIDKRDKLKLLENDIDTIRSESVSPNDETQLEEINEMFNDHKPETKKKGSSQTFSKGEFHLPNILKSKKIKQNLGFFNLVQQNNNRTQPIIKDAGERRKSTLTMKLPYLTDAANKNRSLLIPRKKYKSTIELMESDEANSRRESLINTINYKVSNYNKTTSTTYPKLSSAIKEVREETIQEKPAVEQEKQEEKSQYIKVQTLEAGAHFGLAEVLFEQQPNMCLVSNGCDCVLLSKDVFMQNSTPGYLRTLRREEIPYPSLVDIEKRHQHYSNWRKYTTSLLDNVKRNSKRMQKLNNSMSELHARRTNPVIFRSSLQ